MINESKHFNAEFWIPKQKVNVKNVRFKQEIVHGHSHAK